MQLEQQVVSREYAEKMRDLGFPQNSYFWWKAIGSGIKEKDYRISDSWSKDNKHYGDDVDQFSAYTVAELGEMLLKMTYAYSYPRKYPEWENGHKTYQDEVKWYAKCKEIELSQNSLEKLTESDTEADARAKMLIYLAENKLINPKDITI